jgi:hypothetical protein
MAYRDPTFNANILTDLLGTYLTHNSQEREKYYKAEQQANKPQYKTVDGSVLQIDRDGQIKTLYSKPVVEKEPKFEDFPEMDAEGNPTGRIIKAKFEGGNVEDTNFNLPMGYKGVGVKEQFKPDDIEGKKKSKIEDKNISAMVTEVKRLRNIKDKNFDLVTQIMIDKGIQPPAFTEENAQQLNFYEKELANMGFDIYGVKQSTPTPKSKTTSEEVKKLNKEFPRPIINNKQVKWNQKETTWFNNSRDKVKAFIEAFEKEYPKGSYWWGDAKGFERKKRAREIAKNYFPEEFTSARGNGLDMHILGAYERDEWNLFPKQKTNFWEDN